LFGSPVGVGLIISTLLRHNFSHFLLLVKFNVTAHVGSNILRLPSDLHNFDTIHWEEEGKALSLTSALMPTCPVDFLSSAFGKKYMENRDASFPTCKRNKQQLL
jgi:hypothetical protein